MAARLRTGIPVCAALLFLLHASPIAAQDSISACPAPALAPVVAKAPDRSLAPLVAFAQSLDASSNASGEAVGEVELFRADQYLSTDRLVFNPALQLVELPAPFTYRDAQVQLAAQQGSFELQGDSGAFQEVSFSLVGSTAHGGADSVQLQPGQQTFLDRIWFTTCPGGEPQWRLSADQLELHHADGVGIARHVASELLRAQESPHG